MDMAVFFAWRLMFQRARQLYGVQCCVILTTNGVILQWQGLPGDAQGSVAGASLLATLPGILPTLRLPIINEINKTVVKVIQTEVVCVIAVFC
jgi:hypothetical protein